MKNIYRTVPQRSICREIKPRSIYRDISLFYVEMKNVVEKNVLLLYHKSTLSSKVGKIYPGTGATFGLKALQES